MTMAQTSRPASVHQTGEDQWAIRLWLISVIGLVLAMIVVGGATRLTDSGLSITEWQPIVGAIPPLSAADWQDAFTKYQLTPEYQTVNRGMSLDAFKFIFWWEWAHRFLGRFIGLAFFLPMAVFWWRGTLPRRLRPWVIAILALGGLQGLVGWYMVQSGLVDRIDVSPYRLALHLSIAFLILSLLVRTYHRLSDGELLEPDETAVAPRHIALAGIVLLVVFVQAALGGFVAGLKAGLTYNTWPLMDGDLVPDGMYVLTPWWLNLFENITTVQFNHRVAAYLILTAVIVHAGLLLRGELPRVVKCTALALLAAVVAQASIGILTLLNAEGQIPVGLGLMHQGGGAIVLAIAVWHFETLARRRRS